MLKKETPVSPWNDNIIFVAEGSRSTLSTADEVNTSLRNILSLSGSYIKEKTSVSGKGDFQKYVFKMLPLSRTFYDSFTAPAEQSS